MGKKKIKIEEGRRIKEIISRLKKEFPQATTALKHKNVLQLLVATILSAQCTDVRVNIVTKDLFKKYKRAKDYANAEIKQLEKELSSINFYRNKARNIKKMSQILIERHRGRVPDTMEELLELPGVARKTANIILGIWYNKAEGVVVDTHVLRITQRLGFTGNNAPEKVERDLMEQLPKKEWIDFSNIIIPHGRKTCKARSPLCGECVIGKLCPSFQIVDRRT